MARSRNVTWDYTGEGFIKELDFGRVWLRLNEADEGTKDDIIAEWKEDAQKFLQEAMVRLMSAWFVSQIAQTSFYRITP